MKKVLLSARFFLLFVHLYYTVHADVHLPAVIGSHMVLQQNNTVKLWGWCDPGEKITISTDWDTATYRTAGLSNAKWSTIIKTPVAGGPYTVTITGNNKLVLDDVLVGEVWVCSGQSNMEMNYNWGIKQYTADAENATNKSIRFFHIPRLTAACPQEDTKAKWVVCNPEDMKRFSLAGYFFGQKLQQELNVPIGLINASWGGTPAETWTPADTIESQPGLKEAAARLKGASGWPVNAGATYNAMIYPITGYAIAGVIWYQGEANVGTAATYQSLFTAMIRSWRAGWQKEMPFYFVQIAPFAGYGDGISSALLREAQTNTLAVPHTGMVVIHDLVTDINNIHPQNKKDVGLRLAHYALATTYGKGELPYKSPLYKSSRIEKDKIRIYFDAPDKGLMSRGDTLNGFYIAGGDKVFKPATAVIKGSTVLVGNKDIKAPVAVRFGFTNAAMPNLFSKEGLPVSIFRTDDWSDVDTIKK